ncbi:T9SS type A sorting domain-containing protein [Cruoricaptor ignavus]|uniref:T9SS type A sorting domain-containing protein n=1 Tax=Cruoricaptor ignavus TaxID=1118202 RepID=UPI00370D3C35
MKNLYKKLAALLMIFGVAAIMNAQTIDVTLKHISGSEHSFTMKKTGEKDGKNSFSFANMANGMPFQVSVEWNSAQQMWGFIGFSQAYIAFVSPVASAPNPPSLAEGSWMKYLGDFTLVKFTVNQSGLAAAETDKNSVAVYPNPAADFVVVSTLEGGVATLYSPEGKLLRKDNISAGKNTLDVSALPKGTYILNVNGRAHKLLKK